MKKFSITLFSALMILIILFQFATQVSHAGSDQVVFEAESEILSKEHIAALSVGLPYMSHETHLTEREYVPPTAEVIAETHAQVRSFTCSTVTDVPMIECDALVDLYSNTNGSGWATNTNWLKTTSVSDWDGVNVVNNRVSSLFLFNNQLNGVIPSSLGNLSNLEYLNLSKNQLSGSIPSSLGNLTKLEALVIFQNYLTGIIPSSLGNLNNLWVLALSENQLSGSIPTSLGNLNELIYLYLWGNQLTGTIPSSLGNLSNLTILYLDFNYLSGQIPTSFGNLNKLVELGFGMNLLNGSIPNNFTNLTKLTVFLHYFTYICDPHTPELIAWKAKIRESFSTGIICIAISLNTNLVSAEDRLKYENIINFFADGVYEASNGAHKVGRVTFYVIGEEGFRSDIRWVSRCRPSAAVSGRAVNGRYVNMCDIFQKDKTDPFKVYDVLKNNDTQRMGGYTLAHEWGHYFYGLYDEYVGLEEDNHIFHFPHSDDIAVRNSIMNNQFNAYSSSGNNFNWLNFSIIKNITKKNAQYRAYGASAWDTLTRPVSKDPRNGERVNLPDRIAYPELVNVKPIGSQDSPIVLPGSSRSVLDIVWSSSIITSSSEVLRTDITYEAHLASLLGEDISYPNPIALLAFVNNESLITDMNVTASVEKPNGSISEVIFSDDGIAPDALAGDGLYSAILGYEEDGDFVVTVNFDNNDGSAKYVYTSFAPAIGEDGPVPMPDPVPITENFSVSTSIQISVSGVIPDDHGNTPSESTITATDNEPVPGRIDYAGDKDVFQFEILNTETIIVRITNLALGMNPKIRVIGPDQSTVLFESDLNDSPGDYLQLPLVDVPAGITVYVEVFDVSTEASGGLYDFSAGQIIISDHDPSDDSEHFIFLPIILR